jgi:hypothetical protein
MSPGLWHPQGCGIDATPTKCVPPWRKVCVPAAPIRAFASCGVSYPDLSVRVEVLLVLRTLTQTGPPDLNPRLLQGARKVALTSQEGHCAVAWLRGSPMRIGRNRGLIPPFLQ